MSPILSNPNSLSVSELFYSIQGESTYAGLPCVFIRLVGCNLRCSYCDARFTYEEENVIKTDGELLEYVDQYPDALVEITGGEPLLQAGVYPLMAGLITKKRTVLLETNGSILLDKVPKEVIKIVDMKCPDSGMHDKMLFENLENLGARDEVKFVLCSRNDYDWAVDLLNRFSLQDRCAVLFSPVTEKLKADHLAAWILEDCLPVRLQLQLHKILWPQKSRGA